MGAFSNITVQALPPRMFRDRQPVQHPRERLRVGHVLVERVVVPRHPAPPDGLRAHINVDRDWETQ